MKTTTLLGLTVLLLASVGLWAQTHTLSEGTEIKVRTDTPIPAHAQTGARYAATISEDVPAASGGVAIPRGSRASLVAESTKTAKTQRLTCAPLLSAERLTL